MIDQRLPDCAQRARRKPQIAHYALPNGPRPGPSEAFGGLPHPADRRIIGVQERAYGKCR
jgi:hypothetical protein